MRPGQLLFWATSPLSGTRPGALGRGGSEPPICYDLTPPFPQLPLVPPVRAPAQVTGHRPRAAWPTGAEACWAGRGRMPPWPSGLSPLILPLPLPSLPPGLSPWGPPFYTCEVGWNTPLRGVLWVSAQRGRHILHTDPHRPSRSCPPCPLETPATLRSPVLRAPLCLHPYAVDSPSSPEQGAALLGSASTGQVCGHTLGEC